MFEAARGVCRFVLQVEVDAGKLRKIKPNQVCICGALGIALDLPNSLRDPERGIVDRSFSSNCERALHNVRLCYVADMIARRSIVILARWPMR